MEFAIKRRTHFQSGLLKYPFQGRFNMLNIKTLSALIISASLMASCSNSFKVPEGNSQSMGENLRSEIKNVDTNRLMSPFKNMKDGFSLYSFPQSERNIPIGQKNSTSSSTFSILPKSPFGGFGGRQISGDGTEDALDVTIDSLGNSYAVGFTTGKLFSAHKGGINDGFIAKYDKSGTLVCSNQIGTNENDLITTVVTNKNNEAYALVYSEGDIFSYGLPPAGKMRAFLVKIGSDCSVTAHIPLSEASGYIPPKLSDIAFDSKDNVYIVNIHEGIDGPFDADTYIFKFDPPLSKKLSQKVKSSPDVEAYTGIAIDKNDNLYVTAGNGFSPATGGFLNLTLFKFDSDFKEIWQQNFADPKGGTFGRVALNSLDEPYVIGTIESPLFKPLGSTDGDAVIIKFDPANVLAPKGVQLDMGERLLRAQDFILDKKDQIHLIATNITPTKSSSVYFILDSNLNEINRSDLGMGGSSSMFSSIAIDSAKSQISLTGVTYEGLFGPYGGSGDALIYNFAL